MSRIRTKGYLALALVLSGGLAVVAGLRAYAQMPIQHAVLYAVERDTNPMLRALASFKIGSIRSCPNPAFTGPSSPLSYVVSVMDEPSVDQTRAREVFEYLQRVGCDVNRVTRGGAPIHAAVAFRNADLVSYLLAQGADPNVRIASSTRYSGLDAIGLLDHLCTQPNQGCAETRAALEQSEHRAMSRPE
jgi:hypothetical protein